ncbi:MAG: carboxypeptidase regulatory-like domain-containing protein, partial [Chloroflexaceae bacterium]|nr:carboxypeptidase regulatory-like domain-containing protein [Chloroflexaceae bacterium]
NDAPLNATIEVSKRGSAIRTITIADIPAAGGTRSVVQDFVVQPTLLVLTGTVDNGDGAPLANASISVSIPENRSTSAGTTGADGTYRLYQLVDNAVLRGNLAYAISYGVERINLNVPLAVEPGTVNELVQNITLTARSLVFSGKLTSSENNLAVPNAIVAIEGDGLGTLCTATTNTSGQYACTAQVGSDTPFAITYVVTGTYGTFEFAGDVPYVPAVGESLEYPRDLEIEPTLLRVSGRVVRPNGTGLSGVQVQTTSTGAVNSTGATTDANGEFELYFIYPSSVDTTALRFTMTYGIGSMQQNATVPLTVNSVNEYDAELVFSWRRVRVTGQVLTTYDDTIAVSGAEVRLSTPNNPDCIATSGPSGTYSCPFIDVTTTDPFSVTARVWGAWGEQTAVYTTALSNLPPVGQQGNTTINLLANPVTLRLNGTVRNNEGDTLAGASLTLSGDGAATATTDANGDYTMLLFLSPDQDSVTFTIQAQKGDAFNEETFTIDLENDQLNETTRDLVLESVRRVRFQGRAINEFAPDMSMGRVEMTLSAPGLGRWCAVYVNGDGNYSCLVVNIPTAPLQSENFTFTAIVTGTWGSTTRVYEADVLSLPAGQIGNYTIDIEARPTTVIVSGTVTDGTNPLVGVNVSLTSPFFTGSHTAQTDSAGRYSIGFIPNTSGGTTNNVTVRATRNAVSVEQTVPVTAVADDVVLAPVDLVIDKRQVTFSGRLFNDLIDQYANISGTQINIADANGTLCTVPTSDGNYSCARIVTMQTLAVTYTLSGWWGSTVLTGQVPASGAGSNYPFAKDLNIEPTTLRIRGKISNAAGDPIAGITLTPYSNGITIISYGSATTDANGNYTL